jgi:hypothetical protein
VLNSVIDARRSGLRRHCVTRCLCEALIVNAGDVQRALAQMQAAGARTATLATIDSELK